MSHLTDPPRRAGGAPKRSPFRLLTPIAFGLLVGSALYGGYRYWTGAKQHSAAAAQPDPTMPKPAAEECAIARTVLTAAHASGADKVWKTGAGASEMTLASASKVINPADFAGFTDSEEDDLRGKSAADWRGCAGMGAFVTGLGWSAMSDGAEPIAALALGRPGINKTDDEARTYEAFLAVQPDTGVVKLARGPWLVTLHKDPGGAWRVVSTADLKRAS